MTYCPGKKYRFAKQRLSRNLIDQKINVRSNCLFCHLIMSSISVIARTIIIHVIALNIEVSGFIFMLCSIYNLV